MQQLELKKSELTTLFSVPYSICYSKLTQTDRTLTRLPGTHPQKLHPPSHRHKARSQQWSNQEKGNPLHRKIHLPETIWKLTLQDIKFIAYFLKKTNQKHSQVSWALTQKTLKLPSLV